MKKYLVTGLIILLPLAIALSFLFFLINFLTEPFTGIVSHLLTKSGIIHRGFAFLSTEQAITYLSKLLILILLFLVTLGLGMVARGFFIRSMLRASDLLFQRIPLVNTLYKASRDIVKTLFVSDRNAFKQVVMAPFPRQGSYVLGLVAGDAPTQEELLSVLVLTTPNPTTGFLLMFKRQDLIFLDMKSEDAIKYIISCGVILPKIPSPPSSP